MQMFEQSTEDTLDRLHEQPATSEGVVHQSERNSLFWEIEHTGASTKLSFFNSKKEFSINPPKSLFL